MHFGLVIALVWTCSCASPVLAAAAGSRSTPVEGLWDFQQVHLASLYPGCSLEYDVVLVGVQFEQPLELVASKATTRADDMQASASWYGLVNVSCGGCKIGSSRAPRRAPHHIPSALVPLRHASDHGTSSFLASTLVPGFGGASSWRRTPDFTALAVVAARYTDGCHDVASVDDITTFEQFHGANVESGECWQQLLNADTADALQCDMVFLDGDKQQRPEPAELHLRTQPPVLIAGSTVPLTYSPGYWSSPAAMERVQQLAPAFRTQLGDFEEREHARLSEALRVGRSILRSALPELYGVPLGEQGAGRGGSSDAGGLGDDGGYGVGDGGGDAINSGGNQPQAVIGASSVGGDAGDAELSTFLDASHRVSGQASDATSSDAGREAAKLPPLPPPLEAAFLQAGERNRMGAQEALGAATLAAGIPGLDKMLNPIMDGLLKPVVGALAGTLGGVVGDSVGKLLSATVDSGVTSEITSLLTHSLTSSLTESVVPPLSEALTDSVANTLPGMLRDAVAVAVAERLTAALTLSLSQTLAETLTSQLEEDVPDQLAEELSDELTYYLTQSVTQAVVPALTFTLHHSPAEDYFCAYCHAYQLYCAYCRKDGPEQLYRAQYYAAYYSKYYATAFLNRDSDPQEDALPAHSGGG